MSHESGNIEFVIRVGKFEGNTVTFGDPIVPPFKPLDDHARESAYFKVVDGIYAFATITGQVVRMLSVDIDGPDDRRTKLGYWNSKDLPYYARVGDSLLEIDKREQKN